MGIPRRGIDGTRQGRKKQQNRYRRRDELRGNQRHDGRYENRSGKIEKEGKQRQKRRDDRRLRGSRARRRRDVFVRENNQKKRIKSGSWGGKWKCYYEKEEIAVLDVKDDKDGSLTIEGLQDTLEGSYYTEEHDEFWIRFTDPTGEV